ncbi:hypothetical protein F4819DRAFT_439724 [Hypoxylon fuscum]|nr:hypothetical protein F4819DRAFT_439724 [Hypoxylon fuscum]
MARKVRCAEYSRVLGDSTSIWLFFPFYADDGSMTEGGYAHGGRGWCLWSGGNIYIVYAVYAVYAVQKQAIRRMTKILFTADRAALVYLPSTWVLTPEYIE